MDEVRFALNGAENHHKVWMYTLANQPPDLRYIVNDSRKKRTVLVRQCGSGDILGPFYDGNINWQSYLNLLNDESIPWWQCNFKISSMKIDFIFCGGPRMGSLVLGYWQFVQD